jgi:hypothetical protein
VSPRNWRLRVDDILSASQEIVTFVEGMTLEQFKGDARTIKAVIANFAIIGEAAGHVPQEVSARSEYSVGSDVRHAKRGRTHLFRSETQYPVGNRGSRYPRIDPPIAGDDKVGIV